MQPAIRFKSLRAGLVALGLACCAPAIAASSTAAPAPTHCDTANHRQLDFWIGDWDTFETETPDGASIARARIEPVAGGCALRERYEQGDGLVGDSLLSYDAVRRQWQQTWVTNRGSLMVLWGNFKDGVLVLEGDVHLADGTSFLQRIAWSEQDDGVRERAELSRDGGKTWAPAFDVLFRKRAGGAE